MTENNRIEYKQELTANLEKEVVAFLNAREGGLLYIGLDDHGQTVGVQHVDQLQLAIKDRLKHNIQPSMMGLFEIIHEQRDGKDIIRITIAGGLEKPYYLKKFGMTEKGCFLRIGSAAEPMSREMIESFYGKRVRNTIGGMLSPRHGLSFEQLKIYYEARGLHLNDAFMKNLELLTPDEKPNYAAYLLADDNGVSLQVAKYAGLDRVDLIENRDYGRCSLVKGLKSLLDRIAVENTVFAKITYPLRQERELINSIAIREAIINAVVHNDYSYGATPKLEFFSDRAEVTSMGGLPYGMIESDFFGGCSVPRNKEIMRVFRDLEIVEHLGSGVPRILKAYGREAFEIREGYIRIVFHFTEVESSQSDDERGIKSGPSRDQVGTKSGPSRNQVEILRNCLEAKAISDLMAIAGRVNRTKFRHQVIKPLIDHGWLEMTIPDKPRSSKQQYRTTSAGVVMLKNMDKGQ